VGNLEPTLITDNYLVVSSFNNDLHWIKPRSNNYCVYERGSQGLDVYGLDSDKCFKSPNLGYNIYDYLTYIIENYTTLPECVLFVKGNIFPRHITEQYFDKIANNKIFTPIVDAGTLNCSWPMSTMIGDTLYCELNTSWYLNHHPVKYFNSFNEFLQFVYVAPLLPRYVGFAPGANYIVPRNNILRVPRIVYENLKTFVSYIALPGEAHILERALPIIWNSGYSFSEKILSSMGDMENLPVLSRRNRTWRDYMDGMEYRAQKLVADFLGRLHFW
jgi:hypothetical protein